MTHTPPARRRFLPTFLRITGFGLVGVVLGTLVALVLLGRLDIAITDDMANAELQGILPLSQTALGVTAIVTDIDVSFATDAVGVQAAGDANGFGMTGTFSIASQTTPLYRNGRFYLTGISLDDVTMALDASSQETLSDHMETGRSFLGALTDRLAPDIEPDVLERQKARGMEVMVDSARDLTESVLNTTPVYTMQNHGVLMTIASWALTDIRVADGVLTATLSPLRAVGMLFLYGLFLVLAFAASLGSVFAFLGPRPR